MFRNLWSAIVIVGMFFCASYGASTLNGKITDSKTGNPIAGATIAIFDSTGNVDLYDSSKADGTFSVADVPEGELFVIVSSDGYVEVNEVITFDGTTPVTKNFALITAFKTSISGFIKEKNSKSPISGAVVTVSFFEGENESTLTGTSGSDGAYKIDSVPAGYVVIYATASGYTMTEEDTLYEEITVENPTFDVYMTSATGVKFGTQKHEINNNMRLSKNGVLTLSNISKPGILSLFDINGKKIYSCALNKNCSSIVIPQNSRLRSTAIMATIRMQDNTKISRLLLIQK